MTKEGYQAEAKQPQLIDGPVALNVTPSQTKSGAVQLQVEIQSPDEDCERHADWWEVLSEEGKLLGRHLINEPHDFEQPFTTTDTFSNIQPNQTILIRAHFGGNEDVQYYPTQAQRGTPNKPQSFQSIRLPARFAIHVEDDAPQPQPCED